MATSCGFESRRPHQNRQPEGLDAIGKLRPALARISVETSNHRTTERRLIGIRSSASFETASTLEIRNLKIARALPITPRSDIANSVLSAGSREATLPARLRERRPISYASPRVGTERRMSMIRTSYGFASNYEPLVVTARQPRRHPIGGPGGHKSITSFVIGTGDSQTVASELRQRPLPPGSLNFGCARPCVG